MKVGTITRDGRETLIAAVSDTEGVTLSDAYAAAGLGEAPSTMQALIEAGPNEATRAAGAVLAAPGAVRFPLYGLDWRAPQTRPTKFIGVAINNKGTRKEVHFPTPAPNYFLKAPSCLLGHNHSIVVEEHYGQTIPELELAAVIGKRAWKIPPEQALDHVFGYSIANDITSHGLKFGMDSLATTRPAELVKPHHLSWRKTHGPDDTDVFFVYHTRSKATDTFGPMGPWITTTDEIADPNDLTIEAFVDGEPFAADNTSNLSFSVETVISDASQWFTLEPGDIIIFGTTAKGVGKYPHGHRQIDLHTRACTIDTDIQGLGRLSNSVVHRWEDAV